VSAHPPGIVLHPDLDVAVDALHADPLPVWAWLRRNRPVARIPALGVTVVTRWCDVDRVTRDAEVFSAAVPGSPLVSTIGPNMLHAQGAEHLRMRGLLSGLMRVRRLRDEHEPALRQRAADLLAALGPYGHADIMRELALPLASLLLERLVGLLDLAQQTLGRWLRGIAAGAGNFERDPGKAREAAAVGARGPRRWSPSWRTWARGWDAIVAGEYERAFYGSHYAAMAPLFQHYQVQLRMPETGGRVDYASEHDERAMTMLGLSSKREITRTSIRVRTAMAA